MSFCPIPQGLFPTNVLIQRPQEAIEGHIYPRTVELFVMGPMQLKLALPGSRPSWPRAQDPAVPSFPATNVLPWPLP